jgi:arsenate reductase
MAEGLAREILGPRVTVESAGSHPAKVNPLAVHVLKEEGIDISRHYPKSVDDLPRSFIVQLDYVITLCAEEVCPTLVSKATKLHWPFPDPADFEGAEADKLVRFRETRDGIRKKLQAFQKKLEPSL